MKPTSRGRIPSGLAGMLVLVAAVELWLGLHEPRFMKFFTYDWIFTARQARSEATAAELLCFGDSLVKFGVAPRVLEKRLGLRAYNLAVCGGQAPTSYFLLRRAIEAGARPKAVIVDFMPHLLAHGPRMNLRQWPELVDLREIAELIADTRSASFAAPLVTSALLPSLRARFEIRQSITKTIEREDPSDPQDLAAYERDWRANRGAQLAPERDTSVRHYNLERWEDYYRAWKCNEVNASYAERFLALAEQHDIAVYWLLPPVSEGIEMRRERLGVEERHTRFLSEIQKRHPTVTIIDGRRAGFDQALFIDPLHLDRRGAEALSDAIASVLFSRSKRTDERWVLLPPPETSRLAGRLRKAPGVRAN